MSTEITDADLEAYLDEVLSAESTSEIEERLRNDNALARRLHGILGRRDAGVHSLGVIWRRQRASCPSRDRWGSYLLNVLDADEMDYMRFHLEQIGCRYCQANLDDLNTRQQAAKDASIQRRRRYFQSSAGLLSK